MTSHRLDSFRLQNFKAVKDSGEINFTPLTVFIGNNGSGKSSLIEGLKAFRDIAEDDLVGVMQTWHGYQNIRYRGRSRRKLKGQKRSSKSSSADAIAFEVKGHYDYGPYHVKTEIALDKEKEPLISLEEIRIGRQVHYTRNAKGVVRFQGKAPTEFGTVKIEPSIRMNRGVSIIGEIDFVDKIVSEWQFASLDPVAMGEPALRYPTEGDVRLNEDASNIAEYLFDIRNKDQSAFDGIVETLRFVLPYARNLRPSVASGLDKLIYIGMGEGKFTVPSWLLSTGTLRLIAMLALLRNPEPPPLIVFEELENSLDPRTLSLIVEEIRNAVILGKTQIIATTHSPYLLDLLSLKEIVLVDRSNGEPPTFTRPDQNVLAEWSKKFSPGQLYTMNVLSDTIKR